MLPQSKIPPSYRHLRNGPGVEASRHWLAILLADQEDKEGNSLLMAALLELHVKFALPLLEARVLAATRSGDLAMIDLAADQVTVRTRIACHPTMIQVSEDYHLLFVQNSYSLFVLDAKTLATIQYWFWIEQAGNDWVRNVVAEDSSVERRKMDGGTLDRLGLWGPVYDLGNGKLGARFRKLKLHKHEPESSSGHYVFEIATGVLKRNKDEKFQDGGHRDAPPDDPAFAQKCPVYPPRRPPGIQHCCSPRDHDHGPHRG